MADSRRLEKIDLLAALLRQLDLDEIETVVAFLCGYTRQGRIGVGYAVLRDAAAPEAAGASLEIREVDRTLASLASAQGRGSDQQKRQLLHSLLACATHDEQSFLKGLLLGEIRQGALDGVMLDALAKASGAGAEQIRRAVMMAGDIARVARFGASLQFRGACSVRYPALPAGPADAGSDRGGRRRRADRPRRGCPGIQVRRRPRASPPVRR